MISSPWWQNFFHGLALDFWTAVISDSQTIAEAAFLHRQFQLPVGSEILDVPCGNGRLSIALAKHGFRMTAVDFADEYINPARTHSAEPGLEIDWQLRDMRDLPWPNKFEGAFCFGNSFGFLNDDENAEFLSAVANSLEPGALFILDAPAVAECLLPNLVPHRTMEIAGIKVDVDTRYQAGEKRMFNDFTFSRDGVTEIKPSSQRIYELQELLDLLKQSGFESFDLFSSLDGAPFIQGSQRLLVKTRSTK
jgi:SAM-dependent methyltransferase